MAETCSDPRNSIEDEDLEDGEIETDEEAEEVKPVAPEPIKKVKDDETKRSSSDSKSKGEQHKSTQDGAAKNKTDLNTKGECSNVWQNQNQRICHADGMIHA